MSKEKINILIQSILNPPKDADINKLKAELQKKIGNFTVNTKPIQLLNKKEIDDYVQKWNNSISRLKINKDKIFADPRVTAELNKMNDAMLSFKNGANSIKNVNLQMDNLRTKTMQVAGEFRNINKDGYSFSEMLTLAAKKIAIWGISTSIVYGSLQQLKEGINTLRELDSVLVEINKVTDLSAKAMGRLKKESFDTASFYGRTAQEFLKGVAEFSRAGYEGQAEALSEVSLLAQNVGELTEDQASKFILATDAAYKYKGSQEELTRVLDGVNEIDKLYCPLY